MKTTDWIKKDIIGNWLLCDEYIEKVRGARSKKQLFAICCDANGISFLPEMREKGHPLDYSIIIDEFGRYINGCYKPEFEGLTEKNNGYTGAIYCSCEDKIIVDTTLACLMDCQGNDVWIAPFNFARVVLDTNCAIRLHVPTNSRCVLEIYGNGTADILDCVERVRVRRF